MSMLKSQHTEDNAVGCKSNYYAISITRQNIAEIQYPSAYTTATNAPKKDTIQINEPRWSKNSYCGQRIEEVTYPIIFQTIRI